MKKKLVSLLLSTAMIAAAVTGCGGGQADSADTSSTDSGAAEGAGTEASAADSADAGTADADAGAGRVYYLNFKPEVAEIWEELAQLYTDETGVPVKVVTAASGTYEQTLKSEVAKKDAPTLFQINGPIGYESWKDYCADLSGTDLYGALMDTSLAISNDNGVFGIPYVVEGYGIIYNNAIMDKYFATEGAKAASIEEMNSFDTLKAVVEDMTAKKEELGIDGVFSSTSFAPGDDWRWQTHLANLPVYYEYKDKNIHDTDEIELTYADQYKNIFDLYINNSVIAPTLVGSKTVSDSMAEFALGKSAMVQNGNWGWGDISGVDGNVVAEDDVKFMPIYIGAEGEADQGLCTGTENYFAVNAKVSAEDQNATILFMNWIFSSEVGKDYVTNKLGFIAPFSTFSDDEKPTDPLAKEILRYMADSSKNSVSWDFATFPSQEFKNKVGAALLSYAQGTGEWDNVVTTFTEEWKAEKAAGASE